MYEKEINELYTKYSPSLKSYLRRKCQSNELAEDLTQDTFVKIFKKFDLLPPEPGTKPYILSMGHNLLKDHWRKTNKERLVSDIKDEEIANLTSDDDASVTNDYTFYSLRDCIRDAFQRFAKVHEEKSDALRRAAIEGWSTVELANFLGRSPGATREFISQCRKAFKLYAQVCKEEIQ
ncbi:hypothetical protein MNBD_GAMMA16-191 [hydrothermal vent metagenome]|uniref:RNA polymerase sigma-70 region 2 domain-containing protein n=1 Tax=hydrothermal vent metagenome TaxID=652676 RepID=A0A3B0Z8X3_9ZZZZ